MPSKMSAISSMTLSEIEAKGLAHLLIQNKKIKRQAGRPRKLPERQYQFSLSYWYGLIAADYHKLSRTQRVRVALDCWKTLINRMKALPADPQESKLNAEEAMKMLGKLEKNFQAQEDGGKIDNQQDENDPKMLLNNAPQSFKSDDGKDASISHSQEAGG